MAEVKLDSFTNNSDAARRGLDDANVEPPRHVPTERPSFIRRMADRRFMFAENFEGAGQTVLEEVIIPTLIDGLRDVIYTATDYILYGGGQRHSRSKGRSGNYTQYSKKSQQKSARRASGPSSSAYYFTYDDRASADKDLTSMRDVVDQRDFVTVMDMFAIAKRPCSNYTYNDWGWYDLRSALVRRTSDGSGRYFIDLPKPVPIEDQ